MSGKSAPNRNSLYGRRWRKARIQFLTQRPLCKFCEDEGRLKAATEVDHIKPHDGDETLFWDEANWQGLCSFHHNSVKQAMEQGKPRRGTDLKGNPLDAAGHWQ